PSALQKACEERGVTGTSGGVEMGEGCKVGVGHAGRKRQQNGAFEPLCDRRSGSGAGRQGLGSNAALGDRRDNHEELADAKPRARRRKRVQSRGDGSGQPESKWIGRRADEGVGVNERPVTQAKRGGEIGWAPVAAPEASGQRQVEQRR